jgi:hypothetical protein
MAKNFVNGKMEFTASERVDFATTDLRVDELFPPAITVTGHQNSHCPFSHRHMSLSFHSDIKDGIYYVEAGNPFFGANYLEYLHKDGVNTPNEYPAYKGSLEIKTIDSETNQRTYKADFHLKMKSTYNNASRDVIGSFTCHVEDVRRPA